LTRELLGTANGELPFDAHLDLRILAFNFGLALLVSTLFSLAPAFQFWRPNLMPALKQQTVTAAGGPLRFRRASVAVQIGLSLLLLVGAGLFMRTLQNLKALDLGFAPDHLVTFHIDPSMAGYNDSQIAALNRQILETLQALPGVLSVGATTSAEMSGDDSTSNLTVVGYNAKPDEDLSVQRARVTPGYFSAFKLPFLAGRATSEQDNASAAKIVVVNEAFAKYFFGDPRQAVGHFMGWGAGSGTKTNIQIVGVVRNAKHRNVRDEIGRAVFEPYLQHDAPEAMTFYVRTAHAPQSAEGTIRVAMQKLDSKLVLDAFRTMDEQIDESLTIERIVALLAGSFAVLAVFMAVVGIYGVLAYSTAQRTREIGVRIALGASRAAVLRMVLTEVLWLAGISIGIALPVTLFLTRTLRSQLFGVSSGDPWTFASVTVLLAAVAISAALLPARRAAKVDPMVALRYE